MLLMETKIHIIFTSMEIYLQVLRYDSLYRISQRIINRSLVILNCFSLSDSPICSSWQPNVVGVAFDEHLELTCNVDSNPKDLSFHWAFNNGSRNVNYVHNKNALPKPKVYSGNEDGNAYLTSFTSNGTQSVLTYSPAEVTRYIMF